MKNICIKYNNSFKHLYLVVCNKYLFGIKFNSVICKLNNVSSFFFIYFLFLKILFAFGLIYTISNKFDFF